MTRLTLNQIEDYNNPVAFARPRTTALSASENLPDSPGRIATSNLEESYRLVGGALSRLERMASNLQTMLDLAQQGARRNPTARETRAIYGQLRSLSAGFDQLIDATRFEDEVLFNGSTIDLSLGADNRRLKLADLRANNEATVDLATTRASADVRIEYRPDDFVINQSSGLIGLDLSSASFVPPANGGAELEDGTYKLEVIYEGPASAIVLRTTDGRELERRTDVDLGGTGQEWVTFDAGFRLSIEKENLLTSYDKYDYETNGPVSLFATLSYERIFAHALSTDENPRPDRVSFRNEFPLRDDGGTLGLTAPAFTGVHPGKTELASGYYQVEIDYRGTNSIARLTDASGRLRGFLHGLDLTVPGKTTLNFGVGFVFQVENNGFSSTGTLHVALDYRRQRSPIETFDFAKYGERIQKAMDVLDEQYATLQETGARIEEINRLRNLAHTPNLSPASLRFSGVSTILNAAGARQSPGKLSPEQTQARISLLATQIFQSANAHRTQANQTPQDLAGLRAASPANWLGSFSSHALPIA